MDKQGFRVRMLDGTERRYSSDAWQRLLRQDYQLSKDIAFLNTGCEIAWPSWWQKGERTDCLHLDCTIRRRVHPLWQKPWLARLNSDFRGELDRGWLRFCKESPEGRTRAARLYWMMKKAQTFNIMAAVWTGVGIIAG